MEDRFENSANSLISPAEDCFAIVPDDVTELPKATKAIFVGAAGDISLVPLRGNDAILFRNLPAGSILDVRVRAVKAAGTTATSLVGLS